RPVTRTTGGSPPVAGGQTTLVAKAQVKTRTPSRRPKWASIERPGPSAQSSSAMLEVCRPRDGSQRSNRPRPANVTTHHRPRPRRPTMPPPRADPWGKTRKSRSEERRVGKECRARGRRESGEGQGGGG